MLQAAAARFSLLTCTLPASLCGTCAVRFRHACGSVRIGWSGDIIVRPSFFERSVIARWVLPVGAALSCRELVLGRQQLFLSCTRLHGL